MARAEGDGDDTGWVQIGGPRPRIGGVWPAGGYRLTVSWSAGARAGRVDVVDLAPMVLTYPAFASLREAPNLFDRARPIEGGVVLAWGDDDDAPGMAATTVERLAEEMLSPADFGGWMERHRLGHEAAAAYLGISPGLVAHYANGHPLPRSVSLACRYLDVERGRARRVAAREAAPDLVTGLPGFGAPTAGFGDSVPDSRAGRPVGLHEHQAPFASDDLEDVK